MAPEIAFSGPVPQEALAYFRRKKLRPSFDHRDVWREEHTSSFVVAKAMELDVLTAIRGELDTALAEGLTERQFAKNLRPTLERLGWWGKGQLLDPLTGEVRQVRLGSPRRLRTIYRTNLRTARAAGQWERIQRTKKSHPYLLYQLGPSREHRPEHVALHGLLLPVDDPWWATHMPPNGWGCKCRVRQVSKTEADKLQRQGVRAPAPEQELDPDTGLPTGRISRARVPVRTKAPPVQMREYVNKRTGEVRQVPEGIDPGWDYNPGIAGRLPKVLEDIRDKAEAAHPEDAREVLKSMVDSPYFVEFAAAPKGEFPVLRLSDDAARAIGAKRKVAVVSPETLAKNQAHHPELTRAEYALLPELGADPMVIVQDGERSVVVVKRQGSLYWAAVKTTKTGLGLFVASFRRANRPGVRALMKKGRVVFGAIEE